MPRAPFAFRFCNVVTWVCFAHVMPDCAKAAPQSSNDLETSVITLSGNVERCVKEKIHVLNRTKLKSNSAEIYKYSMHTAAYVSSQLSAYFLAHDLAPDQATPSSEAICESIFEDYKSGRSRAHEDRRKRFEGGLAPLGTMPIEADNLFVDFAHSVHYRHFAGHSDLTYAAWCDIHRPKESTSACDKDLEFNALASGEWIGRASQTPDLFRWDSECFHAHTVSYPPNDVEEKRKAYESSIRAFQTQLELLLERARHYSSSDARRSLAFLGIAAHLVQDLAFHRGMTLQQHAGLSFALGTDPDTPANYVGPAPDSWARAATLTHALFENFRNSIAPGAWSYLRNWRPAKRDEFDSAIREVFRHRSTHTVCSAGRTVDSQDISVSALMRYYLLSLPYRMPMLYSDQNRRPLSELTWPADCEAEQGMACWNEDFVAAPFPP